MPSIPQYRQQTSQDTAVGPRPGFNSGDALAMAGQGLDRIATAYQQKQERDAAAWGTDQLATVRSTTMQDIDQRKKSAPPGAKDFTKSALEAYDQRTAEVLAAAPSPTVRQALRERFAALKDQVYSESVAFEGQAGLQHRKEVVGQAVEKARLSVESAPDTYVDATAEVLFGAQETGMTGQELESFRNDARLSMATASVMGRGRRDPYSTLKELNAADPKDPAVRDLDLDAKVRLRSAMQGEISRREAEARARQAEQRDLLRGDLEDAFAQRQMGLPAVLPERKRFVAAYGADGEARYQAASTRWGAFDAAGEAALLPPADAAKRLDALKGDGGQEGAADRLQAYDLAARLYSEQRRQLEADPAGMLLRRDPTLAAALQAGQDDPTALPAYVSKMRGAQEALGLGDRMRILPDAYASQVAKDLEPNPDKPGARAEKLQALAQQWGKAWPTVVRELAPKMEGAARVMVNMQPEAALRLDAALSQPTEKAAESLPKGEVAAIKERIASELEPFQNSLADNLDAEARIAEHASAATALALSLRLRGASASDAAVQAVQQVVGDQYEFRGLARIPRAYDADAVMNGAKLAQERTLAETLAIRAMPNSDAAGAQRDLKYNVRTAGYWATNQDGTGLVLRIPSARGQGTVYRADGSPVTYTWEALAAMKAERNPGPRDPTFPERNMAVK